MARRKVNLASVNKKKGVMKTTSELATLCWIQACAIILGHFDPRPEVWPNPLGARRGVARNKLMTELTRIKKKLNQESFLKQRIEKGKELLKKQRMKNLEKAMTLVMFQCLGGQLGLLNLNMTHLNDIMTLINQNLNHISWKIQTMDKEQAEAQVQAQAQAQDKAYEPQGPQPPAASSDDLAINGPKSQPEEIMKKQAGVEG